uniref:Uncharacterized protein n=1 Tax=Setaria italica TaxID=4555 RepID=K3ZC33_SETIT
MVHHQVKLHSNRSRLCHLKLTRISIAFIILKSYRRNKLWLKFWKLKFQLNSKTNYSHHPSHTAFRFESIIRNCFVRT